LCEPDMPFDITALWVTRRRLVFSYDIAILLLLLITAAFYVNDVKVHGWISDNYRIFANAMWLGALGGVIISLKGVYDNAGNPPWSDYYNLWHLGRPFSGAATGLITVLIFIALNPGAAPNRPVIYIAALILGTQEARFFTFLSE